jgi:hypothetical protein
MVTVYALEYAAIFDAGICVMSHNVNCSPLS